MWSRDQIQLLPRLLYHRVHVLDPPFHRQRRALLPKRTIHSIDLWSISV